MTLSSVPGLSDSFKWRGANETQRCLHVEVKRNIFWYQWGAQSLTSTEALQELEGKEEGSVHPTGIVWLFLICAQPSRPRTEDARHTKLEAAL